MAPSNKSSTATSASRRKSSKGIVVLKISPKALQRFQTAIKSNEEKSRNSSTPTSKDLSINGNSSAADSVHASNSNTPSQPGTPVSSAMPPPIENAATKRKGVKRSNGASDVSSIQKSRGKPGPKKKARMDETSIEQPNPISRSLNSAAIKLGPKANQGAINAGLRALDRSGKPCRKWAKEGFKLKSFTGICWEIPRWKAPPKVHIIDSRSVVGIGNENKDASQLESEESDKSNTVEIDMGSTVSQPICSPVPPPMSSVETMDTSVLSSPVVTASA